jgi:hypothetical protein
MLLFYIKYFLPGNLISGLAESIAAVLSIRVVEVAEKIDILFMTFKLTMHLNTWSRINLTQRFVNFNPKIKRFLKKTQ